MVSDVDIARSAKRLADQYGDEAFRRAEEHAKALRDNFDEEGAALWSRIAAAILALPKAPSDKPEPDV